MSDSEKIYAEKVAAMSINEKEAGVVVYEHWNNVFDLTASFNEILVGFNNTLSQEGKKFSNYGSVFSIIGIIMLLIQKTPFVILGVGMIFIGWNASKIFSKQIAMKSQKKYLQELTNSGKLKEKS